MTTVDTGPKPSDGVPEHEQLYLINLLLEGNLMQGDILGAVHRIRERYEAALERARPYVEEAVKADGGVEHCEIGLRTDLESIDEALSQPKE
jgi:hypothetical protein